jgi:hypothetical protein
MMTSLLATLRRCFPRILRLPETPRDVFVLDHVRYLTLHSNVEEHTEIQDQHRPKDRDVKSTGERHHESRDDRASTREPELEFW